MIVCVIVGILAAIVLPSYQNQIRKGNRGSAQSHLMDIAQREQQYFLDTRGSYSTSLTDLQMTTPSDVASHYTVTIATNAGPPATFTATATPASGQDQDLAGNALTITNAGVKGPCVDGSGAYSNAPCASGSAPVW
jgi:type IV pilus assembly protein PilE